MDEQVARHLPLPNLALHVIVALAEEPGHGWAVVKRIEELSGGGRTPSTGALYVAITRLQDQSLIEEVAGPPDQDARRRYYGITDLGKRVLRAELDRLAELMRVAGAAVGG